MTDTGLVDRGGRWRLVRLAAVLLVGVTACVVVAVQSGGSGPRVIGTTSAASVPASSIAAAAVPVRYPGVRWPSGTVLVTDTLGTSLWALDPDGAKLRRVWGPGDPTTFVVGPSGTPVAGRVYLVDRYNGEVSVLDPDGRTRSMALLGGSPGEAAVLAVSDGMALAVLQSDSGVAELVQLSTGTVVRAVVLGSNPIAMLASTSSGPGPAGYALSQGDGVTVPGSVKTISRSSSREKATAVGMNPCCAAVGPADSAAAGVLYVPAQDGTLTVIRPDGSSTTVEAGLQSPTSSAVAADGSVLVTDVLGLHVFAADGSPVTLLDQVRLPTRVAVAPAGTPRAGTAYVGGDSGPVAVLPPGVAPVVLDVGVNAQAIAVAPARTPLPGTVYAASLVDGTVTVVTTAGQHLRTVRMAIRPSRLFVIPAE